MLTCHQQSYQGLFHLGTGPFLPPTVSLAAVSGRAHRRILRLPQRPIPAKDTDVHVTRDDKSPLRRAKRWLAQRLGGTRAALGPGISRLGFAEFQVLMAGLRLGLFELLASRPDRTFEEVRDHLRIPDHSTRALLLSTTSLGYTHRNSRGTYRNSRDVHRWLIGPDRVQEIPRLEAFHFLMYQPFYHLTEALQQGTNVGLQRIPGTGNTLYDRLESSPENRRVFYDWMHSLKQKSVASEVVGALRHSRHLLDLGGGDA